MMVSCYIYAVALRTPGHFYIGTTTRPWGVRPEEHRQGK